jgi:hypothetical protein
MPGSINSFNLPRVKQSEPLVKSPKSLKVSVSQKHHSPLRIKMSLQTNVADKENFSTFDKRVSIKSPAASSIDPGLLRSEPQLAPNRQPVHKVKKSKDEKAIVKAKQLNTINKGDKNSPYKKEELEKIYYHSQSPIRAVANSQQQNKDCALHQKQIDELAA